MERFSYFEDFRRSLISQYGATKAEKFAIILGLIISSQHYVFRFKFTIQNNWIKNQKIERSIWHTKKLLSLYSLKISKYFSIAKQIYIKTCKEFRNKIRLDQMKLQLHFDGFKLVKIRYFFFRVKRKIPERKRSKNFRNGRESNQLSWNDVVLQFFKDETIDRNETRAKVYFQVHMSFYRYENILERRKKVRKIYTS